MTRSQAFARWTTRLSARGFTVLPSSHALPVQLWLREPEGTVLHLLARGTRLTLRRYQPSALTWLMLRSACDCEEHRTAGATRRPALAPDARPVAEATYDGAADRGWAGVEAALLDVDAAATVFDALLADLRTSRLRSAS